MRQQQQVYYFKTFINKSKLTTDKRRPSNSGLNCKDLREPTTNIPRKAHPSRVHNNDTFVKVGN